MDIEELVELTPIKVLSHNMNKVANAISEAADDGNNEQVLQLVDSAEALLAAITKLN